MSAPPWQCRNNKLDRLLLSTFFRRIWYLRVIRVTNLSVTAWLSLVHRYLKKCRLLKFWYVPATSTAYSKGIFAAATNSTNQTNKEGSMCHSSVYLSQMSSLKKILPGRNALAYFFRGVGDEWEQFDTWTSPDSFAASFWVTAWQTGQFCRRRFLLTYT